MSPVTGAIRARIARGQAALGVFLVPGFPDWPTSRAAADAALRLGADFVEYPIITGPDWSSRTGPVIAGALTTALTTPPDDPRWAGWVARNPVRIGVVYGSAWPAPDRWAAPAATHAGCAGLLLEFGAADLAGYAAAAPAPLVATVDATRPELADGERTSLATGGGFVYAALSSRTGVRGELGEDARTDAPRKIARARAMRPDLPVCAAFGIESATQVTELRARLGCDGVVVGTAALRALADGLSTFTSWFADLARAAHRPLVHPVTAGSTR